MAILGLSTMGWADDVTGHVPVNIRLTAQTAAGAIGLSRNPADAPLAAITTAAIVNAFNFMDGINGISSLTAVAWGGNAMLIEDESGGELRILGALVAGAGMGFLPHNLFNARLFLGDVGSYALGAAIAAGILSQSTLGGRYRAGSPLLLYAADAGQALVRRRMAGAELSQAHREHVYQRLVDSGLPHFQVALGHGLAATFVAVAGRSGRKRRIAYTATIVVSYICAPYALHLFRSSRSRLDT